MAYGAAMARKKTDDSFSPEEAARRFEAALRGARIVGHKPMSEISPKRPKKKLERQREKHSKP
jgi:hypothetical protein